MKSMNLNKWAIRHNIPAEALADLRQQMGQVVTDPINVSPVDESEAAVQQRIRLEASRLGARLFRNNVGACMDSTNRLVRYGLANDSPALNKTIKSSDLIGIKPVTITESMVGSIIGQFVAREVKAAEWEYTGTDREHAQLKFLELITALGGDAAFATGEGTL